jgi:predicted RNA-binding Zn ribbon-like protein
MRFEFIAGALCLDFANTVHDSRAEDNEEELHSVADLLKWAKEAGLLSSAASDRLNEHYRHNPREATTALAKAVAVRDLLLSLFAGVANHRSVSSQRLSELNSALAETPGTMQVRNKSGRVETEWTSVGNGLEQVLFAVLTNAAELLASERVRRIRECASANCTWLFVDESRNRSRRWCDMAACGNRMKARRHYRRAKAAR